MPRTKGKFKEMRIKSKNNIIQAALKLFSTKGYYATSTNAIAKEAGVAAGLMYNYFGSKEELLVSIIDQFFQELISPISQNYANDHPLLDVGEIIDALIKQVDEKKEQWILLISITFQPNISETCKSHVNKFFLHQLETFEKCFEIQGIDKPKENAKVLWAVLYGAILNYASSGNIEELMLLRRTVIEQLIEKENPRDISLNQTLI
ncbi:MAG: TetR/AcrR family transcriptional regulator [Desulfitobacteriaceae bacterium]